MPSLDRRTFLELLTAPGIGSSFKRTSADARSKGAESFCLVNAMHCKPSLR